MDLKKTFWLIMFCYLLSIIGTFFGLNTWLINILFLFWLPGFIVISKGFIGKTLSLTEKLILSVPLSFVITMGSIYFLFFFGIVIPIFWLMTFFFIVMGLTILEKV